MKKQKIGNTAFYILLFLIFFDYIRPQSNLIFLKPFRIPMITICILTFLGIKQRLWKFDDITTKAFLCMVVISAMYVPFAYNNFWAFQTTRSLFIYFLCYMAIKSFVDSEEKLEKFLNLWLLIGVFCSIKGIFEGGKIVGSGFLGDENDFALYLAMMFPLSYLRLFKTKQNKTKFFYLLSIGVILFGIVKSFSRGGFIAIAGVGFFCWLVSPKKVATLIVALSVLLFAITFMLPKGYLQEIESIKEGTSESTAGERIYSWSCGLRMFYDYPIFGVGPGNFPWRFAEYEPPGKYKGRGHGGRAAHSLYFTLIPEFGVSGIVCFILMIYGPQKKFNLNYRSASIRFSKNKEYLDKLNKYKLLRNVIYCSLAGYLIGGIFLSVLYYPHFWIICGFISALNETMKNEINKMETSY